MKEERGNGRTRLAKGEAGEDEKGPTGEGVEKQTPRAIEPSDVGHAPTASPPSPAGDGGSTAPVRTAQSHLPPPPSANAAAAGAHAPSAADREGGASTKPSAAPGRRPGQHVRVRMEGVGINRPPTGAREPTRGPHAAKHAPCRAHAPSAATRRRVAACGRATRGGSAGPSARAGGPWCTRRARGGAGRAGWGPLPAAAGSGACS